MGASALVAYRKSLVCSNDVFIQLTVEYISTVIITVVLGFFDHMWRNGLLHLSPKGFCFE